MHKVIDYIKHNYLFVSLIAFVVILLIVLVCIRLVNKERLSYTPISGEVAYDVRIREANQYNIIKMEDEDIAVAYYRDWIYLLVNKPEEAYKLLDKKSKLEFDTYEKFQTWMKQFVTVKTKDSTLKGYKITESGSHNEILVSSTENMRYRFNEYSVWNYKVEILGQERNESNTTKPVFNKQKTTR
jgi:hypothetical protein